jgi:hypothetical protein
VNCSCTAINATLSTTDDLPVCQDLVLQQLSAVECWTAQHWLALQIAFSVIHQHCK